MPKIKKETLECRNEPTYLPITSQNEKNITNCIRWYTKLKSPFTKNDIASTLNIQWATVDNIVKGSLKNILIPNSDKDSDCLMLVSSVESYIGISLGSSRIKLTGLDFNFEPLPLTESVKNIIKIILEDYLDILDTENPNSDNKSRGIENIELFELCFNINPNPKTKETVSIFNLINALCLLTIKLKDMLKIGGVGFSFPGIIDVDSKQIKSSYLFRNMNDLSLVDLLEEDVYNDFIAAYGEDFVFDHNSNAACVAEKELGNVARALQGKNNLLVIYGGYGYGVGLALNNKLFLGTKRGGQLGHIQVTPYRTINSNEHLESTTSHRCRCGMFNCLENRINVDVFGATDDNEEELKHKSMEDLCETLNIDNHKEILADYLSQAIYTLSQLFGTEDIVLTGKLTQFYKEIKEELQNKLFTQYSINPKNVKPSILGEFSAAKGVAIEAYYYKYKIPLEWK